MAGRYTTLAGLPGWGYVPVLIGLWTLDVGLWVVGHR
jgi:hypothetical protein